MDIRGRSAIVTGAASGLGAATAERLAADGALVTLVDLPASQGPDVAAKIGDHARFAPADVTNEEQVRAAVEEASARAPLAIAVNCAGVPSATRVLGKSGPFPMEAFRRVVDINLTGSFNVARLAAAQMATQNYDEEERGVIINTASAAAFEGQVGQCAYAASKAAVAGLTLPLARDLAQHRIRVVTIAPGLFHTPMFDTITPEAIRSLTTQVPYPSRLGKPEEYADLAAHIIGNPMLNGEVIRLDGALRMGPR